MHRRFVALEASKVGHSLAKGSPYAFQVLSDRAFGKLKETHTIEHSPYKDLSDEELEAKVKELEQKLAKELGYVKVEPQILPPAEDDQSHAHTTQAGRTSLFVRAARVSLSIWPLASCCSSLFAGNNYDPLEFQTHQKPATHGCTGKLLCQQDLLCETHPYCPTG
jgi:hypothetical protein